MYSQKGAKETKGRYEGIGRLGRGSVTPAWNGPDSTTEWMLVALRYVMSAAASQAASFYRDAAKYQRVCTVLEDKSYLVFKIGDQEVVPFWSTRSRVQKVQAEHEKYRKYVIDEIPLSRYLEVTLVDLQKENIHVGVNWSGPRLTGYDIPPADLRRNIEHHLGKE